MTRMTWMVAALGVVATGCIDGTTDTFDTSDTATVDIYDGPIEVDGDISVSCADGTPDVWTYAVELKGVVPEEGNVTLFLLETGDSNFPGNLSAVNDEEHDLDPGEWDTVNYAWDNWSVELDSLNSEAPPITTLASDDSGETAYSCAYNDDGSLAFKVMVFDEDAEQIDCVYSGHKSEEAFGDDAGCRCGEGDASTDCQ